MRLNALTLTLLIAVIVLVAAGAYYLGRASGGPGSAPPEPAMNQPVVNRPAEPDDAEPPSPPEPPTPSVTPAAFQGEWNARLEDCATGLNDSRLVIGADSLRFHESSGPIKSVSVSGREATFTTELSGEGETWEFSRTFRLSPDGDTLTDVASGLARRRCPA